MSRWYLVYVVFVIEMYICEFAFFEQLAGMVEEKRKDNV